VARRGRQLRAGAGYTKELGKQPAEVFHRGTLGEGMRSAIDAIKHGHQEMIDGWR